MADKNIRVQFVRGDTAKNDAYTGRDGELTIDTERNEVRIHDGVTAGGEVASGHSELLGQVDLGRLPNV